LLADARPPPDRSNHRGENSGDAGGDRDELDRVVGHPGPVEAAQAGDRPGVAGVADAEFRVHPGEEPAPRAERQGGDGADAEGRGRAVGEEERQGRHAAGRADDQEIDVEQPAQQPGDDRVAERPEQEGRRDQKKIEHGEDQDDGREQREFIGRHGVAVSVSSVPKSWHIGPAAAPSFWR